jgi:hypothetical protein
VKDVNYSSETNAKVEGKDALDSTAGISDSVSEPDLSNSFPRIMKTTIGNVPGAAEAYAKLGLSDNIPPAGVLLTIPAALESSEISGSTHIYFPEPYGTITLPGMIYDGLISIGGIYPEPWEWDKEGISLVRSIDILSHDNPVTNMFTLDDYGAFMEQLEDMPGMEEYSEEMEDAMDMLDEFDFEGMPDLGGSGGDEEGFGMSDLNSLIGIMNNMQKCPAGTTFYVEFEVDGRYTEYYE